MSLRDHTNVINIINEGAAQLLTSQDLLKKLQSGKKLKIKLGMDPTSPDLHLGHTVVLSKLKQFQDLDHEVIFLIGDFTARIGDPTGRSKTRPPLTQQEIEYNMKTYFDQVGRILDTKKTVIRYNSEWLSKLTASDLVELCAKVTLARLIEREDFSSRFTNNQPISFHELLYPIFQAYDSVVLHADVELGGTDQTFNLIMGRFLQEQFGQEPQVIVTTPLLEGLDGVNKMSKSLGNAIGLSLPADEAFGKLMSLSDDLMWRYLNVLLFKSQRQIEEWQEQVRVGALHPMVLKKDMAQEIVARFWSAKSALKARESFEALFQKKDLSYAQEVQFPKDFKNPIWIVDLLKQLEAITTSSQAKRLIEDGAVLIDEQLVNDFKAMIAWHSGMTVKAGKHRFYRIK